MNERRDADVSAERRARLEGMHLTRLGEASDVADRPISPKDLLATMYHLLGIDPHYTVHDRAGRPLPLVDGQVLADALA